MLWQLEQLSLTKESDSPFGLRKKSVKAGSPLFKDTVWAKMVKESSIYHSCRMYEYETGQNYFKNYFYFCMGIPLQEDSFAKASQLT